MVLRPVASWMTSAIMAATNNSHTKLPIWYTPTNPSIHAISRITKIVQSTVAPPCDSGFPGYYTHLLCQTEASAADVIKGLSRVVAGRSGRRWNRKGNHWSCPTVGGARHSCPSQAEAKIFSCANFINLCCRITIQHSTTHLQNFFYADCL